MKQSIKPAETPSTWASEALYNKADRYIQQRSQLNSDDWEYALWSSLSLEFLARAALSNVSPALLAETGKSWASLYNALGFAPIEERFTPKSIAMSEVFKRLRSILPDFTSEHENFCIRYTGMRNTELHSGALAFDGINGSTWQPDFYQSCSVLLASMGKTLEDFLGADEAELAEKLVAASADKSAKAVEGDVAAHKKVWLAKNEEERNTLQDQAAVWATRFAGHRVICPACGSQALVVGDPVSAPTQELKDHEIIEKQEYLPGQFECIACALKISGLSRLTVVGLGERYKKTQVYDAAEYYAPDDEYLGYEEDNNEW